MDLVKDPALPLTGVTMGNGVTTRSFNKTPLPYCYRCNERLPRLVAGENYNERSDVQKAHGAVLIAVRLFEKTAG